MGKLFKRNETFLAEISELQEQVTNLTAEKEQLQTEYSERDESESSQLLELTELKESFDRLKCDHEATEAALEVAKEAITDFDQKVAESAQTMVAANSHKPINIDTDKQPKSIREKYLSLSGSEQSEFYNKHKREILKALK